MHIHIHNNEDLPISRAQVEQAGITGHHLTLGQSRDEFAAQSATMEVLVASPWEIARLDLFSAPNLRLVQSTSAGVDALQPFNKIPPQVRLVNNRGTHADKAGEYALMAILMLVNHMPVFFTDQLAGQWRRRTALLARRHRITIIGLGSLGGAAAQKASALGMNITGIRNKAAPHPACTRTLTLDALDEVLPHTDILLLACPLTPATRLLMDARRLALLPATAGIINMGRGRLVEQAALLAALNENRLAGAVLDVFEREPIPPDDPAWRTRNLIITPHMSSDDPQSYNQRTLEIFAANLAAHLAGDPLPTLVDRAQGY